MGFRCTNDILLKIEVIVIKLLCMTTFQLNNSFDYRALKEILESKVHLDLLDPKENEVKEVNQEVLESQAKLERMDSQDSWVNRDSEDPLVSLDPREPQADQEREETQDDQDPMERKVNVDHQVRLEHLVKQDNQALRVRGDLRVLLVMMGNLVHREIEENEDNQAYQERQVYPENRDFVALQVHLDLKAKVVNVDLQGVPGIQDHKDHLGQEESLDREENLV